MNLQTMLIGIGLAIFASWLIAKACDGFEFAADYLGRNMSDGTKGATINAIGSSMPELFVTIIYLFFFQSTTGFAGGIGTTAGSAVFNAMVIPAFVIIAVLWKNSNTKIEVSRKVIIRDGLTLITAEFFLIFFLGEKLEWYHGLMLMLIYLSYAAFMLLSHNRKMKNGLISSEEEEDEDDFEREISNDNRFFSLLKVDLENAVLGKKDVCTGNAVNLLLLATLYISVACYILVESCEMIGHSLNLHGYFVAVIIAAAASSVPDTILSVKDAKKGNYDDAVSNALGSNIFDICFALGAPLFVFTLIYGPIELPSTIVSHITELRVLLLVLTIATFIVFLSAKRMTKRTAFILVLFYVCFVLFIYGRAYDGGISTAVAEKLHLIIGIIQ